jgi:hypothetical protein
LIQRIVGTEPDGVFGPRTAAAVIRELVRRGEAEDGVAGSPAIDARTQKALDSLDAKAVDRFTQFILLAKATAATFGCDYLGICGTRTWEEQEELRKKYLAGGPKAAPAGYSWHNYGTAMDFGVFRMGGMFYCDEKDPALAAKVHAACAVHAPKCGLEWGGAWRGKDCDPPHYQIDMETSSPTGADREKFKREGSVL